MANPIKQLQRFLISNPDGITTGTVIGFEQQNILVSTTDGIKSCIYVAGQYKSGDKVRVQGNVVLTRIASDANLAAFRV